MTTTDKELLLLLVARTSMFIHPMTADSAINFINGYEMGTRDQCNFTMQLRQLLSGKYRISYSSDGWPGQIKRLAQKRASTWLITFRKLTLEVIVAEEGGSLTESQQAILKAIIRVLMERLTPSPIPHNSSFWVEHWLSLCTIKSSWFKQLWTREEWKVITTIDKLVLAEWFAKV